MVVSDYYHFISQTELYNHLVAHGVVVIVIGNGHGDTSSNPGRD